MRVRCVRLGGQRVKGRRAPRPTRVAFVAECLRLHGLLERRDRVLESLARHDRLLWFAGGVGKRGR